MQLPLKYYEVPTSRYQDTANCLPLFLSFRETNMLMSPTREGDFIIKASVVDQISKRQDVC